MTDDLFSWAVNPDIAFDAFVAVFKAAQLDAILNMPAEEAEAANDHRLNVDEKFRLLLEMAHTAAGLSLSDWLKANLQEAGCPDDEIEIHYGAIVRRAHTENVEASAP